MFAFNCHFVRCRCAALCEAWFQCRSFRFYETDGRCQVFDSEQYTNVTCPVDPIGDLYTYFSERYFVGLPTTICVAANSKLAEINDVAGQKNRDAHHLDHRNAKDRRNFLKVPRKDSDEPEGRRHREEQK